jgi:hypothetical protein
VVRDGAPPTREAGRITWAFMLVTPSHRLTFRLRPAIAAALGLALAACTPPETPIGARPHVGTLSEGIYWTTCIDTPSGFVELANLRWGETVRAGSGVRCSDAPVEDFDGRGDTYSNPEQALVKFGLEDNRIDLLARRAPMEFERERRKLCPVQPSLAAFDRTARTLEEAANSPRFSERQRIALRARANDVRQIAPARLMESGSSGSHESTEYYCTDFGADALHMLPAQ